MGLNCTAQNNLAGTGESVLSPISTNHGPLRWTGSHGMCPVPLQLPRNQAASRNKPIKTCSGHLCLQSNATFAKISGKETLLVQDCLCTNAASNELTKPTSQPVPCIATSHIKFRLPTRLASLSEKASSPSPASGSQGSVLDRPPLQGTKPTSPPVPRIATKYFKFRLPTRFASPRRKA